MGVPDRVEQMLNALSSRLSDGGIARDSSTLSQVQTATFPTDTKVLGVLRPTSVEEVSVCLQLSGEHDVPIFPTSRGRNWGYGSRVPNQTDSLVLDLSRLTGFRLDDTFGNITVQPGVTFESARQEIERRNVPFILNDIGGPGGASVLANALERGHSYGSGAEQFDHVRRLQVVLPTGEIINTGFGRDDSGTLDRLHRWGVGPYLPGLFSQSNFGVVTEATINLTPRPSYIETVGFECRSAAAFARVVDNVREARIAHGVRLMSRATPDLAIDVLEGSTLVPSWRGWVKHFADSYGELLHHRYKIFNLLRGNASAVRVTGNAPDLGVAAPLMRGMSVRVRRRSLEAELIASGDHQLEIAYLMKGQEVRDAAHLDEDRCGLIWLTPALSMIGERVLALGRLVYEHCNRYRCLPHLTLHCMGWRYIDAVVGILFDRDDEGADARAMACHGSLLSACEAMGFYEYRTGILSNTNRTTSDLVRRLKLAVDPKEILAPGKC